jgi:trigger factor
LEENVVQLSDSEQELSVTLAPDEYKEDLEKETRAKAKTIRIDGFRKGKAPKHVIKKLFGDSLEYQAAEKVASNVFWKIVHEKPLNPISEPVMTDIAFTPNEPLSFKVKYEVTPKIEAKDYTGLTIETPDLHVSDEELEREIDKIRMSRAEEKEAEVAEDENHAVTLDLQKLDDAGAPVEGAVQPGVDVYLGNPQVNEKLKESALGKKKGDAFEFSFVDDKRKDHPPETYRYTATITAVKKIEKPELTDEFVKEISNGQAKNAEALRETYRKEMQNYYDDTASDIVDMKLEQKILENNPFTPPASLVEKYLTSLVEQEIERAKREKKLAPKAEELREQLAKKAENSVRWVLIRENIVKKEGVKVDDETIEKLANENAEKMNVSVETLKKHYSREDVKSSLLTRAFYDFLREKNTIKKIDPEEFNKKETNE